MKADPCNTCADPGHCVDLGYCALEGFDLIERAISAGLFDLAHQAIAALDDLQGDADLEDPDLEPGCDDDEDGRGRIVIREANEHWPELLQTIRPSSTETLRIESYCRCCGAVTGTEEMAVA